MGGVHFVLAGDFYQLPPVFKDVLYRQSLKKVDEIYQAGIDVYRSCTCFKELIFNFRQLHEKLFLETLQRVRVGQTTDVDVELFRTRTRESVKSNEIESLPPETLFVASRHVTCDIGNSKHIDELEKNGCDVIDCWAIHTRPCKMSSKNKSQSSNEDAENIDIDAGENEKFKFVSNLHMNNASAIDSDEALEILRHNVDSDQGNILVPHLRLCLQARVMLLVNACTEEGLVNGATGTVVGFLYADSKSCSTLPYFARSKIVPNCEKRVDAATLQPSLPIVLVQVDAKFYKDGPSFLDSTPRVVAICPSTFRMKWKNKFIYRTQLPLAIAKYVTVHKCQSVTTDHLVWVLDKFHTMALAYVPPGRVRKLNGLYVIDNQKLLYPWKTRTSFQTSCLKFTKNMFVYVGQ